VGPYGWPRIWCTVAEATSVSGRLRVPLESEVEDGEQREDHRLQQADEEVEELPRMFGSQKD